MPISVKTNMKKILQGIGVSKGKAVGKARIIKNFKNYDKFNKGDILVTELTDPTMVPLMNKAAGIICEIGSITSHPSIVSRELGIPCIVNAKNATKILKDNDSIEMDGESGEIYLVENKNNWRLKWK